MYGIGFNPVERKKLLIEDQHVNIGILPLKANRAVCVSTTEQRDAYRWAKIRKARMQSVV